MMGDKLQKNSTNGRDSDDKGGRAVKEIHSLATKKEPGYDRNPWYDPQKTQIYERNRTQGYTTIPRWPPKRRDCSLRSRAQEKELKRR